MPGLTGKMLDHYRLIEQIGQGGMATIYRAQDTQTLQDVAVKVLSPTISQDKRFVRRFRREAGLVVRLKHPRIVPVLDYGEAEGMVYLVMPFIKGNNLSEHIRKQRLSSADLLRWTDDVASALHYAHTQGIIHRDIKPSNVIINAAGEALLTDFGLAKMADKTSTLTGSMLMGTPAYISPEQGRGQDLDQRSDQYSFGIMLFQLLTGSLPFDGDNPMSIILKHLQEPVPRLRALNPRIPYTVENIVFKSLAKEPEDRFDSVEQLNRYFQAAMRGKAIPDLDLPTAAIPKPDVPSVQHAETSPAPAPARRARWLLPVLLFAVLSTAAVLILTRLDQTRAATGAAINTTTPLPEPTNTVPAAISLPSPTPQPSAVPPVTSQACPGVSLIRLPPEGNQALWLLDNLSNETYRLQDLQDVRWPTANGELEHILLGGQIIWSRGGSEQGAWLEDVPRALPAQTSLTLALDFAWEAGQSGYTFALLLDPACELGGSW